MLLIRCCMHLLQKQKMGRETKVFDSMDDIFEAFEVQVASIKLPAAAPAQQPALPSSSSGAGGAAQQAGLVSLGEAYDALFLAKQKMEIAVSKLEPEYQNLKAAWECMAASTVFTMSAFCSRTPKGSPSHKSRAQLAKRRLLFLYDSTPVSEESPCHSSMSGPGFREQRPLRSAVTHQQPWRYPCVCLTFP